MIQIRESTSPVGVCESGAHSFFNQSPGGPFPPYLLSVAFVRWNFLLHAAKKNNNAAKFFKTAAKFANWLAPKRAHFSVWLISLGHSAYITFRVIMSFRKPCHMPFRKLIPPFTLTALQICSFLSLEKGEACQSILIMLRVKIALSLPEVKKKQLCVKLYFTWSI